MSSEKVHSNTEWDSNMGAKMCFSILADVGQASGQNSAGKLVLHDMLNGSKNQAPESMSQGQDKKRANPCLSLH